jgi:hypothetical protein
VINAAASRAFLTQISILRPVDHASVPDANAALRGDATGNARLRDSQQRPSHPAEVTRASADAAIPLAGGHTAHSTALTRGTMKAVEIGQRLARKRRRVLGER